MKIGFAKSSLLILSLACSTALFAQDKGGAGGGETTYKGKCAGCHGAEGQGKVGPALKGTQLSEDDLVLLLSKGKEGKKAPHTKPIAGLNDEQVKALAHYIKSLK